jgi:hypothetical protein
MDVLLRRQQQQIADLERDIRTQDVAAAMLRGELNRSNIRFNNLSSYCHTLQELLMWQDISYPPTPDLNETDETNSNADTIQYEPLTDSDGETIPFSQSSTNVPNDDGLASIPEDDLQLGALYDTTLDLQPTLPSEAGDSVLVRFTGGAVVELQLPLYHSVDLVVRELRTRDVRLRGARLHVVPHPTTANVYLCNCTHSGGGDNSSEAMTAVEAAASPFAPRWRSLAPSVGAAHSFATPPNINAAMVGPALSAEDEEPEQEIPTRDATLQSEVAFVTETVASGHTGAALAEEHKAECSECSSFAGSLLLLAVLPHKLEPLCSLCSFRPAGRHRRRRW